MVCGGNLFGCHEFPGEKGKILNLNKKLRKTF